MALARADVDHFAVKSSFLSFFLFCSCLAMFLFVLLLICLSVYSLLECRAISLLLSGQCTVHPPALASQTHLNKAQLCRWAKLLFIIQLAFFCLFHLFIRPFLRVI